MGARAAMRRRRLGAATWRTRSRSKATSTGGAASAAGRTSRCSNSHGPSRGFFFSSRRRHTRFDCDWSSDVCSSDLVGHGIGAAFHEEPQVPNYGKPKRGPRLAPGMTIAIEPMINIGGSAIRTLDDKWTVVTQDGSLSAHFEHTVAITDNGPRILTRAD